MKGKRIRNLYELVFAARARRAVVVRISGEILRMPAAFVIGMPARVVHLYFKHGMYLYEKEK